MDRCRSASTRLSAVCIVVLLGAASARGLDVAVDFVEADYLWDRGRSGVGVEVGVLDLFRGDSTHDAIDGNFRGWVSFVKGVTLVDVHATGVVGAAVSQDAVYTGPAPGAGWWTGQTTKRSAMTTMRTQTVAAETFGGGLGDLAGDPVEVITLSIGLAGETRGLDQWSLALDHVVQANGRTITVAAGNGGPGVGTLSGLPTAAYNTITVGATGWNFSKDYTRLADYSSRGPTDDGRVKPDIVAPGSAIHMPTLGGGWADASGTSFATPIVAGGAAVLIGMGGDLGHSTDPKVIKSVLLNSAEKLAGWSHTPTQPLDLAQGAGQMNLRRAYRQYLFGQRDPGTVPGIGWDRQDLDHGGAGDYAMDVYLPAGAVVTATLNWDRIVATDTEDVEAVTYSVDHLDNLDLRLYAAADPGVPVAASNSAVDNVEHIYYAVTNPGRYALRVELAGSVPGDAETYALSWHVGPGEGLDLPGDADLSGSVDLSDLIVLAQNYGRSDRTWFEGDFDEDGFVGPDDLEIAARNWGGAAAASGSVVPEPGVVVLLCVAAAGAIGRRRPLRPAVRVRPAGPRDDIKGY